MSINYACRDETEAECFLKQSKQPKTKKQKNKRGGGGGEREEEKQHTQKTQRTRQITRMGEKLQIPEAICQQNLLLKSTRRSNQHLGR